MTNPSGKTDVEHFEPSNRRHFIYLAATALALLAALLHQWYAHDVAWMLWETSGGIMDYPDGWTHMGTKDWAWTIPIHLPAGACFAYDVKPWGIVFLFLGSLAWGWVISQTVLAYCFGQHRPCGRYGWRLWIVFFGLAWVPVQGPWSWIWQWTVVY